MKKLPIGIQDFRELIDGGYVYVDKTEYLYRLISEGKVYFLSRPRRFGKSLLVSTLEQIFRGNRGLFEGLYIHDKIEWRKHPVIKLDMTQLAYESPEGLKQALMDHVRSVGEAYGLEISGRSPKDIFAALIKELSRTGKVALLIDEYDKPIIGALTKTEECAAYREILKDFYGVIKGLDAYLKFVFLTGVSKFSRTSIFSDLNNLRDITMAEDYNEICGYREEDLERYFDGYFERFAEKHGVGKEAILERFRTWYNGYSWNGGERLYNPFSTLNALADRQFRNYWFETGTPTFLINLMREKRYDLTRLEDLLLIESGFSKFEIEDIAVEALLFQTGYLTIQEVVDKGAERYYRLGYPNYEVERSLLDHLLVGYTETPGIRDGRLLLQLREALESGNLEAFFAGVESFFAGIPYAIFIAQEWYFASIVYAVLAILGLEGRFEMLTNRGRLDCAVELGERVYIFGFKLNQAPEKALEQIKQRGYAEKYRASGKRITLVGVAFDAEKRNVGGWKVEEERA
ncbi:MAG: AAA family ATPase [Candidatus Hydrogenedentota bacterium]|nr:MAG: AAA family ATPase [Candidatus Hydrogenedentota bacterium]